MSNRVPDAGEYRFRLPRGFARLRSNFGEIIRMKRQKYAIKQEVLAFDAGISRGALSRIENGAALPRPETLDRLLAELDMEIADVAVEGKGLRAQRMFDGSNRGEKQAELGSTLRRCRREANLRLHQLAALSGISASQLSRIERGQSRYSKLFAWNPESMHRDPEQRSIGSTNAILRNLIEGRSIGAEAAADE